MGEDVMIMCRKIITALAVLTSLAITPAWAQDNDSAPADEKKQSDGELTTKATNPVGALIQLQLQDLYVPDSDNSSGYANTFIVQPVVPISLGDDGYFQNIITRPTIPIVTTPKVNGNRETGVGDITWLTAPTHTTFGSKRGEFTTWGPIAAVVLPTASKPQTGADVWSAGPGAIAVTNLSLANGDSLMLGGLAYHLWGLDIAALEVRKWLITCRQARKLTCINAPVTHRPIFAILRGGDIEAPRTWSRQSVSTKVRGN
jgi:hypothetical protein